MAAQSKEAPRCFLGGGQRRENDEIPQKEEASFIFEERRTLWVRDRTQRVRRSNPSGFDLEPRRVRRTTNPLGSRSNPEGSKIEPLWVRSRTQKGSKIEPFWVRVFESRRVHVFEPFWIRSRTQKGSKIEPFWVRDRTQRVRSSNPLGSTNLEGFVSSNPSGFEIEPRGFDLRTLWVPRTQKGSKIEPSWVSNPSGFVEPRGFDLEPRRVRRYEPFWVRGTQRVRSRTQKGSKIRTLLGSWNPEGSKNEPSGFVEPRGFEDMNPSEFEDTNPEGFDLRTRLGSRSNPEGFDLRTLWVRSRTQRVRRSSNPSGFEIEPRRVRSSNPLGSISNPEGSSFFEDELRR
ncbi:hypothetical protein ACOSQ4_010742 [Xanthoceras sorbifolium]